VADSVAAKARRDAGMNASLALAKATALPCWQGRIEIEPLPGGMSNWNFRVGDSSGRYVVRINGDVLEHGIRRDAERRSTEAAYRAGLGAEPVYAEPDVLVVRWIDGRTLTAADVRAPATLSRIVGMLRQCHDDVSRHLRGPAPFFWVFHAIRDYISTLRDVDAADARLPEWSRRADDMEREVGPVDLKFGHNDLLAANLIDDGRRLWLIDWEYAGFNTPLFDLVNLAGNNGFDAALRRCLAEAYFQRPYDDRLDRQLAAMTVASFLREGLWGLVSVRFPRLATDFSGYATENLAKFDDAFAAFAQSYGGRRGSPSP
jgi:thiamine kinase-like enzyme